MNSRTDDRAPHPGAEGGGEPPTPLNSQRSERPLVLMVEDSDPDRDVYGGLLWYNGYDVAHVPDGPQALRKALEVRPALILMDLELPGGMSGVDVARRLREQGVTAPIIALTAHPRAEMGAAAEEAGMVGYLEKPISPFEVVKEVMRRIGHASGGR